MLLFFSATFLNTVIGATYFMTNDPRGNYIIASSIQQDGRLGFSRAFPTGGLGGYNKPPAKPESQIHGNDPLSSQHSLIVSDELLFAVNAGSNSVSMFTINPHQPTELTLEGAAASGGEFPVSVAFSRDRRTLCILNGGAKNGVRCLLLVNDPQTRRRSLVLLPEMTKDLNQPITTPPGVAFSVSDIIFTPDSSQLLVSVKGSPVDNQTGYVASFTMDGKGVLNYPRGALTPFGLSILPGTGLTTEPVLVFADPFGGGYGVGVLSSSGFMRASVMVPVPGQIATCWTDFSPRSGHLFTTDDDANTVTESAIDVKSLLPRIVSQYRIPGAPNDASIASLSDKDVLYTLAPGVPGIQVLSLATAGSAQHIQQYSPVLPNNPEIVLNTGVQGMATYLIRN